MHKGLVLLTSSVVSSAGLSLSICQLQKQALPWHNFPTLHWPLSYMCVLFALAGYNRCHIFIFPPFFSSRFLPSCEVALHARRKALSTPASQESDDLCASRGAGLLPNVIPERRQHTSTEVRPSAGHAASPQHAAALPDQRTVGVSPDPRSPAPASVRQPARPQPHHRGAQQNPGTLHAEVGTISDAFTNVTCKDVLNAFKND